MTRILASLALVALAGTGAHGDDLSTETSAAREPREILLGMSTALSGPAADLGKNFRDGVQAWLEHVNRHGGIRGRPIRLLVLDDGYEPRRTAPNMRQLVEKERVLAIIGNVGTPTATAALPIAIENQTLFFAAYTGAAILRETPPNRYVINFRASYAEETEAMIDAIFRYTDLAPDEIAFFTQHDGHGDAGFAGGLAALRRHGLLKDAEVTHLRYERNSLEVEHAVAEALLLPKTPRAIILVSAYAPSAKFIRLAREAGINALFLNVSFVGGASLARELGSIDGKIIVTQVVPHVDSDLPSVREYREDSQRSTSGGTRTFAGLEGYLAARVLTRAIDAIPGKIERETLIDALEGLGKFDLAIGEALEISPDEHQASHRVWATRLDGSGFSPFEWSRLPEVLGE